MIKWSCTMRQRHTSYPHGLLMHHTWGYDSVSWSLTATASYSFAIIYLFFSYHCDKVWYHRIIEVGRDLWGWFQCWAASRREDGWKRQPDTHILVGVALFKGRTKTIGNSFWIKPSFWVWMQVRDFHWNGSGKKCSLCPAKHTVLPRKKLFVSRRRVKGSQMVALQNCLCMDGTGLRVYIQGCWKSPLNSPFFASDLWIGLFYKVYFLEECLWLYLSTMTYGHYSMGTF